jgi:tRNA threonylcarbamoyladenosine biosynthesis protein TsaE
MPSQSTPTPATPPVPAATIELRSRSARQTRALGVLLGGLLEPGDVVLLRGSLGAGKTVFAQGIGASLGVAEPINSPTYVLLKEYSGRIPFYHLDLYRIEDPEELFGLGLDQYFGGDGVCVVEWSDRADGQGPEGAPWPEDWLRVTLRVRGPHTRALLCEAAGARGRALMTQFARAAGVEGGAG